MLRIIRKIPGRLRTIFARLVRKGPAGSRTIVFAERKFTVQTGTSTLRVDNTIPPDGSYEPWLTKYLALGSQYYGADKDAVDIGASVGIITLILATLQNRGTVFAFEPLSAMHEQLRTNLARNNVANVKTTRAIVSDTNGDQRQINVPRGYGANSFVSLLDAKQKQPGIAHAEVSETVTLDSFLSRQDGANKLNIKLLKIDVENWELRVLHGARATIEGHDPVVCIEFNVQTRSIEMERKGHELFREITRLFKYVFLIDRLSQKLMPVVSYGQLRGSMLTGHFVEDLLCFNDPDFARFLGKNIAGQQLPAYFAGRVTLPATGSRVLVSLSHYPDDWCHGHDFFLFAGNLTGNKKDTAIQITLENDGPHAENRLLIVIDDEMQAVTLGRDAVSRELNIGTHDPTFVYIFVEKEFKAARFYNNADPRQLGVRIRITEAGRDDAVDAAQ